MSDAVNTAIEAQIGHEFGASQQYLSMAGYFEAESLGGFASWMREQSQEEKDDHARSGGEGVNGVGAGSTTPRSNAPASCQPTS